MVTTKRGCEQSCGGAPRRVLPDATRVLPVATFAFLTMLLDRSHRGWAALSALLLFIASVLYAMYATNWPGGPSGRTWPGILFGVAGTSMMVFAGALSARKKTVRLRFGTLAWWLKGHIWLGLLSVPLIFFHSAFRFGGWLEIVLWGILAIIVISGVVGLILQNVIPRTMKLQLPTEFIPDQFAEVCKRLILSADEKIMKLCTPAVVQAAATRPTDKTATAGGQPFDWLASFHIQTVRPFLAPGPLTDSRLASAEQAQLLFDGVRSSLPQTCWATVDGLEESCSERRQLAHQERLFRLLHGWTKVHIPFSVALAVFTAIHVIFSLYF
jgi:hypothetical protein